MVAGELVVKLPVNDVDQVNEHVENGTLVPFLRRHITEAEVTVTSYDNNDGSD